jgi:hypothetical protein
MESHDEERTVYRNINFGTSFGSYNIKDTATALKRMELNSAFFFTIPGPKMIWQFGELGYDYPINYCEDGTINNDCRLSPKPIRWDYVNDSRRKSVYNTYSKLMSLRKHPWYKEMFLSGTVNRSLNSAVKWIRVNTGDSSYLLVIGNFGTNVQSGSVSFPAAGTWFDYLANTTFAATGGSQVINLLPGEFHVYVNRNVNNVSVTPVNEVPWNRHTLEAKGYPNPLAGEEFHVAVDIPQSTRLTIEMYNALGQYVTTVYEGFLVKGSHQLALKNNISPKGNYYLKVQTKTATKTIQVTIQ